VQDLLEAGGQVQDALLGLLRAHVLDVCKSQHPRRAVCEHRDVHLHTQCWQIDKSLTVVMSGCQVISTSWNGASHAQEVVPFHSSKWP
jgi:hypothetical protein